MKSQSNQAKILYIITQGIWGGAQRYVFDLATHLSPNFSVTVAVGESQGPQDLQQAIKGSNKPNLSIHQLHNLVRAIRPIKDLKAIFEIRNLVKTEQPDILHLNSTKAGIIGSLAMFGLKNRPKVIYTVHGWVFLEPLSPLVRWIYKFLEKHTAQFKDQLIILSDKEKKIAQKLGIPDSKLSIIPIGINPPVFYPTQLARKQIKKITNFTKQPTNWVGTIANLYKTKGLDILIRAVPEILKIKPNTHFFIIGAGPEKIPLTKLITQLHLTNHIHLVGAQNNAAALLLAFDLFVLPSRKEGLPYTILEAMSAKIPIVATAVGGVGSLLADYPLSRLSAPNNVSILTEAVLAGLQLNSTSLSSNQIATVNTVATMVEQTSNYYR